MANISMADGILYFSKSALDACRHELSDWVKHHRQNYYGFSWLDADPEEILNTYAGLMIGFSANGRWSLYSMLDSDQFLFTDAEGYDDMTRLIKKLYEADEQFTISYDDWEPGCEVLYKAKAHMVPYINDTGDYDLHYDEFFEDNLEYTAPNIIRTKECDVYYDFHKKADYEDWVSGHSSFKVVSGADDKIRKKVNADSYFRGFVMDWDDLCVIDWLEDEGLLEVVS